MDSSLNFARIFTGLIENQWAIKRAEYADPFGSWFIEIGHPNAHCRVLFDGKDARLMIEEQLDSDWRERWIAKTPAEQTVESVLAVVRDIAPYKWEK